MDQKILDALKKINIKLGGTNGKNERVGTLLEKIEENVESGYTPPDGEPLVITIIADHDNNTCAADTTFEEIRNFEGFTRYVHWIDIEEGEITEDWVYPVYSYMSIDPRLLDGKNVIVLPEPCSYNYTPVGNQIKFTMWFNALCVDSDDNWYNLNTQGFTLADNVSVPELYPLVGD